MLYKNRTASEEERVNDLLSRMTVDEKLAQLYMHQDPLEISKMIEEGTYPEEGISATNANRNTPVEVFNKIQKYQVENTRLGIPILVTGESIHGVMYPGTTVFPQCIGLASTFNTGLVEKIADVCGAEARAVGIRQTFAPDLDLAREPRWGRVEETYGEDPYLVAVMGTAYVKAVQKHSVAATIKHYIAYGSPEGGLNLAPNHLGEREMRENMLEPFAKAIAEGKAMSVMPSYAEIDGIPVHGSYYLLTELLRGELGFDGYTVSDFGAVMMLHSFHNVAETPVEAGKIALMSGVDLEAGQRECQGEAFLREVREGRFPIKYVDEAVRRILRVKIRLGLFEDPYALPDWEKRLRKAESVRLAKEAADESVVLLKNEDAILPLSQSFKKIAVIGPNSHEAQLGDYTVPEAFREQAVTLKSALISRFGEDRVICAEGCGISERSEKLLAEAVDAAKSADFTVVVLGDSSNSFGGVGWGDESFAGAVTCGEGFDVNSLALPAAQKELLYAVAETKTPVVLVLIIGRPYCIGEELSLSKAVLQAWYPGEQGGNSLCDILFGDVNPSGKLPVSFPKTTGHIPCFYNYKASARGYYKKPGSPEKPGRDYVFDSPEPLFPFGYGLSYTEFKYRDLSVRETGNNRVSVSVTVENTGRKGGKETVLLFLRQNYCRVSPFVRRLRGFEKIYLNPGENKTVSFTLDEDDFTFINEKMEKEVGSGRFTVFIGNLKEEFII